MNIQGLSSRSNAFFSGAPQAAQGLGKSTPQPLQSQGAGQGFPTGDAFEGLSSKRGPDLGGGSNSAGKRGDPATAIRDSLHHAGVDQATSQAVMDAVRSGTPLGTALQNAGVTPEQHQIVMSSVLAQDPR
ncbi:MAG TPA: hypothetical protein VFB81_25075 [Myxococcales bacterium]|nr:hypothetical protein [Myxococcales bacterium]